MMDFSGPSLPNGFSVLPIQLNESSRAIHYMYYKAHRVRDQKAETPEGRTLLLINVPPYCTEESVKRLFADMGHIQQVYFNQNCTNNLVSRKESKCFPTMKAIKGYKVAYLVFKKPEDLQRALKLKITEPLILSTKDNPLLLGIKKWRKQYNESIPNVKDMQKSIDTFMAKYDKQAEQERNKEKEMDGIPDEEGWIKVTKHSKRPTLSRSEAQSRKITLKEKRKRSQKELKNFYTFQIRESKMEHIAQLRKQFEEDKQRIAIMRASRKFKPY